MVVKGTVDWLLLRLSVGGISAFKESLGDMYNSVGKPLSDEKCQKWYKLIMEYKQAHKNYKSEYGKILEEMNSLEI